MEKFLTVGALYDLIMQVKPEMIETGQVEEEDSKFYNLIVNTFLAHDDAECEKAGKMYNNIITAYEKQGFIAGYKIAAGLMASVQLPE